MASGRTYRLDRLDKRKGWPVVISIFVVSLLFAFVLGAAVGLLGTGMATAARKRALDEREADIAAREFYTYIAPATVGSSTVKPRPYRGHQEREATLDELAAVAIDESPADPVPSTTTERIRAYVRSWRPRDETGSFEAIRPVRAERDRTAGLSVATITARLRAEHAAQINEPVGGNAP